MLPTPDLSHLSEDDRIRVYDPAEDTFLLLDSLEKDAEQLKTQNPLICLEVGSGSGSVFHYSVTVIDEVPVYLCTDINHHASVCTLATGKQNKIPLNPITCDLSRPLLTRLRHRVDIILFNPPYVPTSHEDSLHAQSDPDIASSWAGGLEGMEVTNRFLDSVGDLLSDGGKFYLVALTRNNIPEVCERMRRRFNMNSRIVLGRRAGSERLSVICFCR